jgi:hypothetical protein
VRREFQDRNPRPNRKRWVVVTLVAAAVLFALIGSAVSQTPSPVPAPWTADSEFVSYGPDGSSVIEMNATSYAYAGIEVLLGRSDPRNPLATAFYRVADAAVPAVGRAMQRALGTPSKGPRPDDVRAFGYVTGCGDHSLTGCLQLEHYYFLKRPDTCIGGSVAGTQTILNHPTIGVLVQMGDSMRSTFWVAPDLGCFALRIGTEKRQPDGAFHLVEEKRVVRISTTAR